MTEALKNEILQAVAAAGDVSAIEAIRVDVLGKKGKVTELLKTLGGMDEAARKTQGAAINLLKDEVANAIDNKKAALEKAALTERLKTETVDITLSAAPQPRGTIHPTTQIMEELVEIFASQGFELFDGPDIESDQYNFEDLNIPQHHPARQMQASFALPVGADGTNWVPRTHTSPVQVRIMQACKPPFRKFYMGRTYRRDFDATHTPMFHQFEIMAIDKDFTMANLRGCLQEFLTSLLGEGVKTRFRPSYFPFTEPSVEVDVNCDKTGGKLQLGQGNDWMEILGGGMVHPNVLRAGGIDPDEWQGFAAGLGVDRLAMLKYGIPDLRPMFESDVRWLQHYGFAPNEIPSKARGSL